MDKIFIKCWEIEKLSRITEYTVRSYVGGGGVGVIRLLFIPFVFILFRTSFARRERGWGNVLRICKH